MPVTVGPSTLTINYDRQFLISQPNATILPQDDVGFSASDTRFVSGSGLTLNGRPPKLLDPITVEHFSARYASSSRASRPQAASRRPHPDPPPRAEEGKIR